MRLFSFITRTVVCLLLLVIRNTLLLPKIFLNKHHTVSSRVWSQATKDFPEDFCGHLLHVTLRLPKIFLEISADICYMQYSGFL